MQYKQFNLTQHLNILNLQQSILYIKRIMIRGTTQEQDCRFADKTKKMLQNSVWPDKYDTKIDLTKVDLDLINSWIQKKVYRLIGQEDDIITGTITSLLQDSLQKLQKPNAKKIHISLSGFLKDKTLTFMSEFWDILDQAQKSSNGIPQCLIDQKKKQQQEQQKKLQQLNKKRNKYQNNKFDQVIKRHIPSERQRQRQRQKEKQRQRKKNKQRERERSRSHHKKSKKQKKQKRRRSYSYSSDSDESDRHKQKQKKEKHKHKQKYESNNKNAQKHRIQNQKKVQKQSKKSRKQSSSQSSSVVSSSSSQQSN